MNICIWWDIPCKAIMGVFKELTNFKDVELILITGRLNKSRIEMGWENYERIISNHIILEDDEWDSRGIMLLEKHADCLNIFGGAYNPPRINKLIRVAVKRGIQFGVFSEAPNNPYSGLKHGIAYLYQNFIVPFKTIRLAKKSLFVFCLSGSDKGVIKKLQTLGWSKDKIIPFGYFSEDNYLSKIRFVNNIPNIFCSGNLVKNKGVEILLRALKIISQQEIDFKCHITGKGENEAFLKELSNKLELSSKVVFHGVLKQSEYDTLQSQMDIMVAPGIAEPWGIRINEAIQFGQAVIVGEKIGAKELIISSKGGVVFKTKNYVDLSNKLLYYLTKADKLHEAQKNNLVYKTKISPKNISYFMFSTIASIIHNEPHPQASWLI